MSTLYTLQPDAELLLKYRYIQLVKPTKTSKEHKAKVGIKHDVLEQGYHLKMDFSYVPFTISKFKEKMYNLAYKYNLNQNVETLIYIVLEEHECAVEMVNAEYEALHYRAIAKELADLIVKEPPVEIFKKKVCDSDVTSMPAFQRDAVNLAREKVQSFIVHAVREKLLRLDRTVMDLGPEVLNMVIGENINPLLATLDQARISSASRQRKNLRHANTRRTQILTEFLLRTWDFINQETNLKAPQGKDFTDTQMALLYDIAVLLKWKDRVNKEKAADRMRALFDNYLINNRK